MAAEKKEIRVIITGFGGQGIVLTGSILGQAATLLDGRQATMTQSYGPEARGGSRSSQVVVSDVEIAFPKSLPALVPGGTLAWDTKLVKTGEHDPSWRTFDVPATAIAAEMGNKMMANIVMLGFLSAVHPPASPQAMREAMLAAVPPRTKEKNALAFDKGREQSEATLKAQTKQGQRRSRS